VRFCMLSGRLIVEGRKEVWISDCGYCGAGLLLEVAVLFWSEFEGWARSVVVRVELSLRGVIRSLVKGGMGRKL
jgi:hypothetical protein